MSELVIPGRYLLEVEYPVVLRDRGIECDSWVTGEHFYVPGLKRLSPLKLTTWAPHQDGRYVHPDVLDASNRLQEEAFRLWAGSEPFALTLAPGTLNEVRYPKVILTTLRPMGSTRMGEGPGCEMEFTILAVPQTVLQKDPWNIPTKEPNVKIYEAVIVKLDEKGDPAEVVKVVAPFVAKSTRAAQDEVLIDYAGEAGIKGKDLAGYSVRIREFQAGL